jgi:hypothetical protein
MPLTKLQFRPGINRETTSYSNEGGWFDCDKVRFRSGFPEKVGGWLRKSGRSFLGSCRALHPWVALDGTEYIGVGTHLKYYVEEGGAFNDITPIRSTTAAGDVTFSATDGSSTITVTDSNHDAVIGDFVTFSGAASLGGVITADVLNQEYQIDDVLNANTYTFTARTAGTTIEDITVDGQLDPTPVVANASDSGSGGGSTVGTYQINIGLDTSVAGNGWGAGIWGRGTWGSGTSLTAVTDILRIWSHDNFGEDLIINVRDGGIYYWDKSTSSTPFVRAVELKDVSGNTDTLTPTIAKQVIVSDVDRHVIAFGCDPIDAIGTQDPLLVRFSSQEDALTWTPTAENTAGDLRIGSGSEIICAVETRQQVLIWTDISLHAMQFLGPPFTFGIQAISENTTIMGPLAAMAVDDVVYWMGDEDFYVYDGRVKELPSTVKEYVFNDFNLAQREKAVAALNSSFNEVWWFYPSSSSDTVDRYVVYNYQSNIWYYGTLARTAWIDRGINTLPIAASTDGYLYFQEAGLNDGSTTPPSPIEAYIESSQVDIDDGDSFSFIRRIIPDVTFNGSSASAPTVDMILKARNFPGGSYLITDTAAVTRTATVPVELFTNQVHVRLRGRSVALRVESDDTDVQWRLGTPRVDLQRDGRR